MVGWNEGNYAEIHAETLGNCKMTHPFKEATKKGKSFNYNIRDINTQIRATANCRTCISFML